MLGSVAAYNFRGFLSLGDLSSLPKKTKLASSLGGCLASLNPPQNRLNRSSVLGTPPPDASSSLGEHRIMGDVYRS